jgi:hypothetical protein
LTDGLSEFAEEPVVETIAASPAAHIAATEAVTVEESLPPAPVPTLADAEVSSPLPTGTGLSISELLDNGATIDWREAVAIVRSICDAIARHPSAGSHEYMLDPRHIEISEQGEVLVLPGAPGGDPFVKQVGRILRALLENGTAPAPLRLLASQASFELSGFDTVRELSEALSAYDAPQEAEAIRTAFKRGREAKFSYRPLPEWSLAPSNASSATSASSVATWEAFAPRRRRSRRWLSGAIAATLIVAVVVGGYKLLELALRPSSASVSTNQRVSAPAPRPASSTPSQSNDAARLAPPPSTANAERSQMPKERTAASQPDGRSANRQRASTSSAESSSTPAVVTNVETRVADRVVPPVPTESPEAMRRRFDALVTANPLYRLDPARASAEEVLALRESKRQLLPSAAGRDVATAKRALEIGDVDEAQSSAARAAAIMDDPDFGPVQPLLRESVRTVMTQARALRAGADDHVYTSADAGIVPPLPLGRQLPATGPSGIASELIGQLELVIGRNGQVEAVKLHTPLNRYHERMIVSAAKAWRYEPARKDGTSVRFRLFRTVTLPED